LLHAEPFGSASKMEFLCYSYEMPEMTNLHFVIIRDNKEARVPVRFGETACFYYPSKGTLGLLLDDEAEDSGVMLQPMIREPALTGSYVI